MAQRTGRTLPFVYDNQSSSSSQSFSNPFSPTSPIPSSQEYSEQDVAVTLTPQQQRVMDLAQSGKSFLVSGGAGTGKSFVLRHLVHYLRQNLQDQVVVTASTGIAAVQISGLTIHSFAGIGLGQEDATAMAKKMHRAAKTRWRECSVLVIDEISMLDSELFDKLEKVASIVRRNNRPFGGLQLILFGDFLQLPPVKSQRPSTPFAFQAESWPKIIDEVVELTESIRQRDPVFISLLRLIRIGNTSPPVIKMLQQVQDRTRKELQDCHFLSPKSKKTAEIEHTILYCKNRDVDSENFKRLQDLGKAQEMTFEAIDTGREVSRFTNQLNSFIPQRITLKVGAQVMLTKNVSVSGSLCNGARGVVVGFEGRLPLVKFSTQTVKIERQKFSIEDKQITLASRSQIPLRLAWSITIHKSQGMTIEKMSTALSDVFESAQFYVALSRCPSINNLRLLSFSERCIRCHSIALSWIELVCPGIFQAISKDLSVLVQHLHVPQSLTPPAKKTNIEAQSKPTVSVSGQDLLSRVTKSGSKSLEIDISKLRCPVHQDLVRKVKIIEGNGQDNVVFMCNSYPICVFEILFEK
ncbi:hypothetical protein P9112_008822 [Eukaryota sp. TZLM1-RC]